MVIVMEDIIFPVLFVLLNKPIYNIWAILNSENAKGGCGISRPQSRLLKAQFNGSNHTGGKVPVPTEALTSTAYFGRAEATTTDWLSNALEAIQVI